MDTYHLSFELNADEATYFQRRMEDILAEIKTRLPDTLAEQEPVLQKCRWILAEFITNAYKHSNQSSVALNIEFQAGCMRIVKEDSGTPLCFELPNGDRVCWPLNETYLDKELNVFHDQLNVLNARIDNKGMVTFSVHQNPEKDPSIHKLNEHFGLIIITSICREFSYTYEKLSGKNIFSSVISY